MAVVAGSALAVVALAVVVRPMLRREHRASGYRMPLRANPCTK